MGPVFALAYGNGVVYAGGTFGNALPPGTPAGTTTGEVARTFLAAFNSTTGALITSFDPTITYSGTNPHPGVYAMALSPDGSTLYVGGIFDHVNGVARNNLAAFNTATGALTSWAPATGSLRCVRLRSPPTARRSTSAARSAHMDNVARTFAAAVDTSGKLLPWAPVLDSSVYALAVAPDDSQVLLGGYFQHINGVSQNSAGAVDPVNGTTNHAVVAPANLSRSNLGLPVLGQEHRDQRQHRLLRRRGQRRRLLRRRLRGQPGQHRLAAVAERLPGRDPGAGGRQRVLVQGLARA